MRKHLRFERVDNKIITVQCSAMTPRILMDMVSDDVMPEVKARKGSYGNGSEQYPIPRSMNISRLASMSSRPTLPAQTPPAQAPPAQTPPAGE